MFIWHPYVSIYSRRPSARGVEARPLPRRLHVPVSSRTNPSIISVATGPGECEVVCPRRPRFVRSGVHVETYEARGLEVPVETWGSTGGTLVFLPGLGCPPERVPTRHPSWPRGRTGSSRPGPLLSQRLGRLPRTVHGLLRSRLRGLPARPSPPEAPWCGHSFGALLALMRPGPAIALRAHPCPRGDRVRPNRGTRGRETTDEREYLGREGPAGPHGTRPGSFRDYADRRRCEGPARSSRSRTTFGPSPFGVSASVRPMRAVVYLSRRDELYRPIENTRSTSPRFGGRDSDIRRRARGVPRLAHHRTPTCSPSASPRRWTTLQAGA